MTKRMRIACLLLAAVALGVGAFLVRPRAIGPAAFQRIRSGMSLHEVENVIGLPHGDYFTRPESSDSSAPYWGLRGQGGAPAAHLRTNTTRVGSKKASVRYWRGNDYYIQVAFDENDSAIAWSLHEAEEWSVIERIRSWFGQ